jgi:ABC-type uncharacterized transport system substrate-binding protein
LMGCGVDQTENGALLSYEANRYRVGQRAAWYVDRILKGTKPKDLPVEAPIYFELTISLKTAKQIGPHDSAERVGASGQSNQVRRGVSDE